MCRRAAAANGRLQGFTLIELLVAVALAATLITMAAPSFTAFIANNRAASLSNEMVGALMLARNEAVTRATQVSVCAASDASGTACASGAGTINWGNGWILFVDAAGTPGTIDVGDTVLRVYPPLDGSASLTASTAFVRYREDGFLAAGATTLALRVPRCRLDNNRDIQVSAQGRPAISHVAC